MDLLNRLEARWKRAGLSGFRGSSEPELTSFEKVHGVRLPPTFKAYLHRFGGAGIYLPEDDGMARLWPLAEIEPADSLINDVERARGVAALPAEVGLFFFSDVMIHSSFLALQLNENPNDANPVFWSPGPSLKGEKGPPEAPDNPGAWLVQVASSFDRWLQAYLELGEERQYLGVFHDGRYLG